MTFRANVKDGTNAGWRKVSAAGKQAWTCGKCATLNARFWVTCSAGCGERRPV